MNLDDIIKTVHNGEQISNLKFEEEDWSDAELAEAQFANCTFSQMRFRGTCLEEAHFEKCTFIGCSFPQALLKSSTFTDCVFFDRNSGKGADLSHSDLRDIPFTGCNLSTSRFKNVNLYEGQFLNCMAQGCDFEGASFNHAIAGSSKHINTSVRFQNSNLEYANFYKASLIGCSLTECILREANLRSCDFKDADMSGSDLTGADIMRACFEGTNLQNADLSGFQLGDVTSFYNMKVSDGAQKDLLFGLGIQVIG